MSEEMRDCKESKQSLTEVRKAERNPQESKLTVVHSPYSDEGKIMTIKIKST